MRDLRCILIVYVYVFVFNKLPYYKILFTYYYFGHLPVNGIALIIIIKDIYILYFSYKHHQ